jgi:tetratricopeptide (TPR) repeat protein
MLDEGRVDAVVDATTRLLALGFELTSLFWLRGLALVEQGRPGEALDDLKHAADDWEIAFAYADYARALDAAGRNRDAVASQQRAVALEPADAALQMDLGWYAYEGGDLELALDATKRAIELDPSNLMARFNAGLALLAAGSETEAIEAYEAAARAALALGPDERGDDVRAAHKDLEDLLARRHPDPSTIARIDRALRRLP